jgi:hypothetical protein
MIKRVLCPLALVLLVATVATAQDSIPDEKQYTVELAVYSLALDYADDTPTTEVELARVLMARDILASPGVKWSKLAEYAHAYKEGQGQSVDWSSVTFANAKTVIGSIWDIVAVSKFGTAPTISE